MNYWIHPEAEADLGDAAVYYATHASRLIAEAFLAESERVRDLLIENQKRGPLWVSVQISNASLQLAPLQ